MKRASVNQMFAGIAPTYDRVNGLMSFNLHHRWRQRAVQMLGLKGGETVLDLCCGTGDFYLPLAKAVGDHGQVVGVDFCVPMLEQARHKHPLVPLQLGDACQMPLQDRSVDEVTVGWGIRNVPDIDGAHREIFRVLRPGGRFVSVDMARPHLPVINQLSRLAFHRGVPLLGKLFGNEEAYTYLPKSTDQFLTRAQLKSSMELAGFKDVSWIDLFFGNICIHFGVKP